MGKADYPAVQVAYSDCPSRIFGDTRFLASSGEFTAGVLPPASVSAVVLAGVADGQVHR
jgi:hypothetical protein